MKRRRKLFLLISLIPLSYLLYVLLSKLNSAIVSLVSGSGIYRVIEEYIIPAEVNMTMFMTHLLHIKAHASGQIISVAHNGRWQSFSIIWNCTGWQSMLLLLISFAILFQYKGIVFKKAVIVLTGIVWIFFTNIFRISLEIAVYHLAGFQPAMIYHDYFAKAFIILMFALFWFLVYALVLKKEAEKVMLPARLTMEKKLIDNKI